MDHSGVVYVREFDGKAYDFGVVGVDRGTLIMYDKQTGSRWSQLMGEAVSGPMEGKRLAKLPSTMTTWSRWREMHPDTTVYVKPSIDYRPKFTSKTVGDLAAMGDGPLESRDLIVGVEGHVQAKAYPFRRLATGRLVHDTLEDAGILVYLSEDMTSARVFHRSVGEQVMTFTLGEGDHLEDEETGSRWDAMTGEALSGPMKGKRLSPIISTYSLWFAWKKYRPDTVVYGDE